jgi:hypothetical protein
MLVALKLADLLSDLIMPISPPPLPQSHTGSYYKDNGQANKCHPS